jgi:hypothetical protein
VDVDAHDASVVEADEGAALRERVVAAEPFLACHQEKATPRVIPLVRPERTS